VEPRDKAVPSLILDPSMVSHHLPYFLLSLFLKDAEFFFSGLCFNVGLLCAACCVVFFGLFFLVFFSFLLFLLSQLSDTTCDPPPPERSIADFVYFYSSFLPGLQVAHFGRSLQVRCSPIILPSIPSCFRCVFLRCCLREREESVPGSRDPLCLPLRSVASSISTFLTGRTPEM